MITILYKFIYYDERAVIVDITFLCLVDLLSSPLAASSYSLASWWCCEDSRLHGQKK